MTRSVLWVVAVWLLLPLVQASLSFGTRGAATRQLQAPTFFVDWTGTGDGTLYDFDTQGTNTWTSETGNTIANVPDEFYTQEMFRTHRSSFVLTYTLRPGLFEPLSVNRIEIGLAEFYHCGQTDGRELDITVNGVFIANGLNVYETVGCNTAYFLTAVLPAKLDGTYEVHIAESKGGVMFSTLAIQPSNVPLPEYRESLVINPKL